MNKDQTEGMNKDQIEGPVENIKGRIKEAAGIVTGRKNLEAEGAAERVKGTVKKAVGNLKHNIAKKLEKDPLDEDGDDQ